jgi:hypothetical protein
MNSHFLPTHIQPVFHTIKDPSLPAHTPIQGPLPTTDLPRRLDIVQPIAPPKEHEPSAPTLDSHTRGPCHSTNSSTQDHVCTTQTLTPHLKVIGVHTKNTPQNELLRIPHIRVSLPQDTQHINLEFSTQVSTKAALTWNSTLAPPVNIPSYNSNQQSHPQPSNNNPY